MLQVNDLMEQNRALHQQNALEAAKVNAVKQEMLALDAQHRQYVKEAEERTMHSEVATERHFTADREQLLKSHARLVEALELQHRTKLSIIEGRLKSTQVSFQAPMCVDFMIVGVAAFGLFTGRPGGKVSLHLPDTCCRIVDTCFAQTGGP